MQGQECITLTQGRLDSGARTALLWQGGGPRHAHAASPPGAHAQARALPPARPPVASHASHALYSYTTRPSCPPPSTHLLQVNDSVMLDLESGKVRPAAGRLPASLPASPLPVPAPRAPAGALCRASHHPPNHSLDSLTRSRLFPSPFLSPPLQIKDFIKFDVGNLAIATGGHNNGRVGTIVHKEKHKGSFDIVHIRDAGET